MSLEDDPVDHPDAGHFPPLTGPRDPPVFSFVPGASARALLLCDHASAAVPAALDGLGLPEAAFARHIAIDLHAADVTHGLAARLGVPAFLHGCSRLVIDANRAWDDATLCPAVSDGTAVPGNVALSEHARRCRWEQLHQPYHRAIDAWLHERLRAGDRPALVSIHSFTPELGGEKRRWPVAALWNRDGRMAQPFLRALRELDGLDAGDNVPYSGRVGFGYTMAMHAEPHGLPHLLIELRQDVLATPAQREAWIDLLARRLTPLIDDPALRRPFCVASAD